MHNYQIEGSTNSPEVRIDGNKGIVDISGSSDLSLQNTFTRISPDGFMPLTLVQTKQESSISG
jgi:hypothetical protein